MPKDWKRAVRIAIAGTERLPLQSSEWTHLPVNSVPNGEDAGFALTILSAVHLLNKATLPVSICENLPPAPAPTGNKPCPPGVEKDARRILEGPYRQALPEFVSLLVQSGTEFPAAALPAFFQQAGSYKDCLARVLVHSAPLATWLAAQHPEWQKLLPETDPDWHTGSIVQRQNLLRKMRAEQPDEARKLLQSTWSEDPAPYREQLLTELRENLSKKDLVFLELAATDRSRPVRLLACRLLMLLPENEKKAAFQLLLHATEWNGHAPALPPGNDFKPTLEYLAALRQKTEHSAPLESLLELLPPGNLSEHLDQPPENILQKWLKQPGYTVFVPALVQATVLHRYKNWTNAVCTLLEQFPENPSWHSETISTLFETLPAEEWAALCSRLCRQTSMLTSEHSALVKTLRGSTNPWTGDLFQALLDRLQAFNSSPWIQPGHFFLRPILQTGAYRCEPETVDRACRLWMAPYDQTKHPWQAEIQQCAAIARFRLGMRAHFAAST